MSGVSPSAGPRPTPRPAPIARLLQGQGFGTRRECEALCAAGRVALAGRTMDDPFEPVQPADGLVLTVDGTDWPWLAQATVLLHKPAGTECSRAPRDHPSVLSLLPLPLQRRGVQPVGRLDADTTGVLLLTDDGALLHRLTSPRQHVAKVYEVTAKHPVDGAQLARLRDGVVLHDDPAPVRAEGVEATGERSLRLVLREGRYHQVKRMVAAAGNRVEALHRSAFAGCTLDGLAPGQWRWLSAAERQALGAPG